MTSSGRMTQTQRGRAFEYAVASAMSRVLDAPLDETSASNARGYYDICPDSGDMDRAGSEAAMFLAAFDKQFEDAQSVRLQSGNAGQQGDVRDIIIDLSTSEIGISAKTQSVEVRAPRLSSTIDFGRRWAGYPVSSMYWNAVRPIFEEMREMRSDGVLFRDLDDKDETIYLPVLKAFEDEFRRLCESFGRRFIGRVFRYLIGRYDFYKIVRHKEHVDVESFNLDGTLDWGARWTIPEEIQFMQTIRGKSNILLVGFDGGTQLSFRIHNANRYVEPSLKFSITFVGYPANAARNQIPIEPV